MNKTIYHIEWEVKDKPGVKHYGPPLYLRSQSGRIISPRSKEEANTLADKANKNFTRATYKAVVYNRKTVSLRT